MSNIHIKGYNDNDDRLDLYEQGGWMNEDATAILRGKRFEEPELTYAEHQAAVAARAPRQPKEIHE